SMSFRQLHDPGFVLVSATLAEDQSLDEVRKITLQTLEGAVQQPPAPEEVDRVKTRLLRGIEQRLTDAQQLGLALSTPISQGDWRLLYLEYDQIKSVTPDDVLRVAKFYFKASNRTVGEFIPASTPERTVVTARANLETLFKDYKSGVTVARGEDFEPTPANIESRTVRGRLDNGMKL